jgi:hypothetical protein
MARVATSFSSRGWVRVVAWGEQEEDGLAGGVERVGIGHLRTSAC